MHAGGWDHMSAKTEPLNTLVEPNIQVSQVTPTDTEKVEIDAIEVFNAGT